MWKAQTEERQRNDLHTQREATTEARKMEGDGQVLVVSPEADHCDRISAAVYRSGLKAYCCKKLEEARFLLLKRRFSVVFCNDTLPDGDFQGVVATATPTPVVVLSRFAEWDHYLKALRAGAYEYLTCPPDPKETERIIWLAIHDEGTQTAAGGLRVLAERGDSAAADRGKPTK